MIVSLQFHHGGQAPLRVLPPISPTPPTAAVITVPHASEETHWGASPFTDTHLPYVEISVEPAHGESEDTPLVPDTPSNNRREEGAADVWSKSLLSQGRIHDLSATGSMKNSKTKATIGLLSTLITYVSLNSLYKTLDPEAFIWQDEDRDEAAWIATSKSWFDRKACRWLGLCGIGHLHIGGSDFGNKVRHREEPLKRRNVTSEWGDMWSDGIERPEEWTDDERALRQIPDYVLEYAPLVHLFSGEQFWPTDVAEHLYHTTPMLNYTPLQSNSRHPTLSNLNELNQWDHGRDIFLTSDDNVEELPDWLVGERNIPTVPSDPDDILDLTHVPGPTHSDSFNGVDTPSGWEAAKLFDFDTESDEDVPVVSGGIKKILHEQLKRSEQQLLTTTQVQGGRSDAPAILIVVAKDHGIVDAFWFFFYSFNLGNTVFGFRAGNHVGDWEHTAVRFQHGEPKAVFFSEHSFGSAYSYAAVEKIGKRPVIYSATGTHANYATPGLHPYVLPWGILHDETDRGPLWDPVLNNYAYTYDVSNHTFRSSVLTPKAPVEWLDFNGHYGDRFYPLSDTRQSRVAGFLRYVSGPLGPKFKNLGRKKICGGPESEPCVIKNWLSEMNRPQRWQNVGEGERPSKEDVELYFGNETRT